MHFFLRWLFLQNKFHVLQLPPGNQTFYKIYAVKVGKKMAQSLTPRKSPQIFFPGKNRNRKIREKSGHEILDICCQILRMDSSNYYYIRKFWNSVVILTNFDIFQIKISEAIWTNSLKIGQIYIFYIIYVYENQ